jgi:BarA-like signal transduction histidine kinase
MWVHGSGTNMTELHDRITEKANQLIHFVIVHLASERETEKTSRIRNNVATDLCTKPVSKSS